MKSEIEEKRENIFPTSSRNRNLNSLNSRTFFLFSFLCEKVNEDTASQTHRKTTGEVCRKLRRLCSVRNFGRKRLKLNQQTEKTIWETRKKKKILYTENDNNHYDTDIDKKTGDEIAIMIIIRCLLSAGLQLLTEYIPFTSLSSNR